MFRYLLLALISGIICGTHAQNLDTVIESLHAREQEAFTKSYHWTATVYSKDTQDYPHEFTVTVDLKIEPLSEGVLLFRGTYPALNTEKGGYELLEFHALYHSEWYGCITYDTSGKVPYSFTVVRTQFHALSQPLPFCSAWVTPENAPFLIEAVPLSLIEAKTETDSSVEISQSDDENLVFSIQKDLNTKSQIVYNIQNKTIGESRFFEGFEAVPQDMIGREVSDEEVMQRLRNGQLTMKLIRSHRAVEWRKVGNLWLPNEFVEDCPGCIGDRYQITWRLQSVQDVKSPRDWRTEIPKGIVVMDYRHCGPVAGTIPEGCQPAIYEWQGDFEDRAPAGATSNRPVPWLSWILVATPILLIILGTLWLLKRWRQAHA